MEKEQKTVTMMHCIPPITYGAPRGRYDVTGITIQPIEKAEW